MAALFILCLAAIHINTLQLSMRALHIGFVPLRRYANRSIEVETASRKNYGSKS